MAFICNLATTPVYECNQTTAIDVIHGPDQPSIQQCIAYSQATVASLKTKLDPTSNLYPVVRCRVVR